MFPRLFPPELFVTADGPDRQCLAYIIQLCMAETMGRMNSLANTVTARLTVGVVDNESLRAYVDCRRYLQYLSFRLQSLSTRS
jgi:hypothetical protein